MAEITITSKNFEDEVVKSDKPVLIDFWAPWCGPCRSLSPIISEIAEEHPEIKVGKCNVDDESEFSSNFGVMSIPTLVLMKAGKVVNSSVGLVSKDVVERMISE